MPGDPACWSNIFYDDETTSESESMSKPRNTTTKSSSSKSSTNSKPAIAADIADGMVLIGLSGLEFLSPG